MVIMMDALLLKVKVTDGEVGRKLSEMKEKEKKRIEDLCSKVTSEPHHCNQLANEYN